ncbi:LacI family DNA-binding transcriptional regulator [Isoptericola sp. AK164]|uniref:LacI family DNA-binding transcriptional regulator n=1 Tax=Isoptericola sp. AK164 TaxID=3024246 RepID=UPI0024187D70|nr:LacI family DNA-binding transcriptional regulator [Isoptericola sp. AK164]
MARRAGVSPALVSYVLNDGPRPVSAAARERVLAAVHELGYRPDGLARSLRVGRTSTLGLVVPDAVNPFFGELAHAVEDAAFGIGYAVMVCNSADSSARERTYVTSLAERRIDGLILASTSEETDLSDLTDLAIPVIALDRAPDAAPISTIRVENATGAYLGTRHLVEHAHDRIAFVGGPDTGVSTLRREGYLHALQEAGRPPWRELRTSAFTLAAGADIANELLAGDAPTAVMVASEVQAIGLVTGLGRLGARVPGDIAVVAMDGTAAGAHASPRLTTVAQPIRRMAEMAVTHLVRSPARVVHEALHGDLVVRESCGCPARS